MSGMTRDPVGALPEPVAGTLRPWIDQLELLTDAIIQRDRELALLALLADRTIVDVDVGLAMGRELMDAHADVPARVSLGLLGNEVPCLYPGQLRLASRSDSLSLDEAPFRQPLRWESESRNPVPSPSGRGS